MDEELDALAQSGNGVGILGRFGLDDSRSGASACSETIECLGRMMK
jgi:hypothetical protein